MFADVGQVFNFYRENTELERQYFLLNREFHEYFLKPLVFNVGLFLIIYLKSRVAKSFWLVLIIVLIFPTSMARFAAASLYGSILFLYLFNLRYFDKSFGVVVVLINIIGILVVFPILDLFRRPTDLTDDVLSFGFIFSGHFDAFQNFCLSLAISPFFGANLLGALFFWIPRSIWESKVSASNIYLAESYNFSFDNVSFPLPAEFFSAFGFFGLILGGILTGSLLFYLDKSWKSFLKARNLFGVVILLQLAQLSIYIMRGALLSSFAYVSGILFGWLIIYFFLLKR